ncbi:unnamed protein product [Urochloa humidicola]
MPAASTAAAAAVGAVLPKLAALLQEEEGGDGDVGGLIIRGGARRDAAFLRDELQQMQHTFEAAAESRGDHYVEEKSRKLRDLCYDIEDSVDSFLRRTPPESKTKKPAGLFGRLADRVHGLTTRALRRHRFAGFMSELKEVSGPVKDYSCFRELSRKRVRGEDYYSRRRHPACLVGMGNQRDELVRLLLVGDDNDNDKWLRVVSICGPSGLGKTTLADEVCRAIRGNFDCVAWVSLSAPRRDRGAADEVLRSILRQVGGGGGEGMRDLQLQAAVRGYLEQKRYLLVVDDAERWNIFSTAIRLALPHTNRLGSRVITTARSILGADSCCTHWNDRVYYMRRLHSEYSQLLFHGRIFGSVETCPPHLADVAREILEKCRGFPLAIATVSSLLASYRLQSRSLWEEVCDYIGSRVDSWRNEDEGMRRILSMGYHNLPYHLTVCLWHLSMFPADYPIDHDRVIRCWVAEGLVGEKPGKTAEEVGESYLDELMDRQMIRPDHHGRSKDGKTTKAYVISSMMLELIRSESVAENFATVLEDGKPVSALPSKIRRLSINNIRGGHDIPASLFKRNPDIPASVAMSRVRSLYIFGSVGKKKLAFKRLIFLRVMDLQGCKDLKNQDVEEIAGLRDLRYLSIRDTPISEIPDRIGQLQHLRTLDLRGTQVQELPTSVLQLQRLGHLLCDIL